MRGMEGGREREGREGGEGKREEERRERGERRGRGGNEGEKGGRQGERERGGRVRGVVNSPTEQVQDLPLPGVSLTERGHHTAGSTPSRLTSGVEQHGTQPRRLPQSGTELRH